MALRPDLKRSIFAPEGTCSAEASSIGQYVLSTGWSHPLGRTGHKLHLTRLPASELHGVTASWESSSKGKSQSDGRGEKEESLHF